jgi:hypothetical protein
VARRAVARSAELRATALPPRSAEEVAASFPESWRSARAFRPARCSSWTAAWCCERSQPRGSGAPRAPHVEYEVIARSAFADTAFCKRYGCAGRSANDPRRIEKEPKSYAACVVLATTQLDVNHVRALPRRLSLFRDRRGDEDFLGMEVGA